LDHAVELTAHFCDLTTTEQQAGAIRGRTVDDRWILKKKFWCERQEGDEASWKELYYSFSYEESFINWPENENAWANFPSEYQALITQLPERGTRPNAQIREQLKNLAREQNPSLVGRSAPNWNPNPGGGGNWKSNANSIIPRFIYVKAVHDATEESISKGASSYGKIVSLIIEKKLMQRPEVVELKHNIEAVLRLFNPDPDHPEMQAPEIRDVEDRINSRLNRVIAGTVSIRTSEVEIEPLLLPSTYLVLKDRPDGVDTSPAHQGHGLQRTLVMTLLQILAEIQVETMPTEGERRSFGIPPRPVLLAVEEPELYMHPQMERKMRDVLYGLADQPDFQVICTTHSPVFLDIGQSHKTIVRVVKDADRTVRLIQVIQDLFGDSNANAERERLQLIRTFHPAVNEMFFARRVVLFEEYSAVVAFERAAELIGLFNRHPHLRRDITLVDCQGKPNIPLYQRVLNHFAIPYTVIHDLDEGNIPEQATNARIAGLLPTPAGSNKCHPIGPTNLEGLLNHVAGRGDKPYKSRKRVEELHRHGTLPAEFLTALCWVYFGQDAEPTPPMPG
ncbi:MAG: ATP-dependent endonuclease, partial [Terriglobia bacterium]